MTFLLALLACEPEDLCERAERVDPSLVVGEGEDSFAPVDDGHAYLAEAGPQGGHHIWVALETTGIHPGRYSLTADDELPVAEIALSRADGGEAGRGLHSGLAWEGEPERAVTFGIQTFLEPDWEGFGELLLEATVDDACGTSLEAARTIRLR